MTSYSQVFTAINCATRLCNDFFSIISYMSMVFVSSCFWLHHKLLSVQQLMHGAFLDNL